MDYTLIVTFTDEKAWLQAASLISGLRRWPMEEGQEGNTLDIQVGKAGANRINAEFNRLWPRDPNIPLPGQLPLLDPGDASNE